MPALSLARDILLTADPREKAAAARHMRAEWRAHVDIGAPIADLPVQPARPAKPELVPPMQVPRRRLGSPEGRGALLHAVAHIELNAIDLAADMIARFALHSDIADEDRASFIDDWSSVCDDEARHFIMLADRLDQLGLAYGDYPAHNGLWEAAQSTRDNFAARVAIAPLVLEARGLDVTPGMIKRLISVGDTESARLLQIIYDEEIGHVATGARWFQYLAKTHAQHPESWFHTLVREHFRGQVKSPFNEKARTLAGLSTAYYMPLAAKTL
ncbi:ferritin-like domain-containing protein [Litorimonas sp. WD9-15]|uniref:ferritin-like domain-containing protein n=1 Tax=Litorimonas sp. WD9-15 TaxID=3418716 RepID=UPI003D00FA8A